jgi:hypothetical protein
MSSIAVIPESSKKALSVIQNLMIGFAYSKALSELCTLGVADLLKRDGPQTAEQLAKSLAASPQVQLPSSIKGPPLPSYLHRTMRAAAYCGVFDEVNEGNQEKFRLNVVSEHLCIDHPLNNRWMSSFIPGMPLFDMMGSMGQVIRTGKQASEIMKGHPSCFEWFQELPEEQLVFQNAMKGSMTVPIKCMPNKEIDFTRFSKVVDIGGSLGHVLKGILESSPSTQGVVFDLPHITENSIQANVSDEILGDKSRVEYVGGNFFESVPEGDGFIISRVIHDWNDEKSILILQNCAKAMKGDHGRVFIIDVVVPEFGYADKKEQDDSRFFYDIYMMVVCGAQERTVKEFSSLFSQSGLEYVDVYPIENSYLSVVEAKKKTK